MPGQDVEDGRTGAGLIDDLSQLLLGRIKGPFRPSSASKAPDQRCVAA